MSDWTAHELATFDSADELRIAGRRADGSLRKLVIIWMVTREGALYVRSVNGASAAWFRGTQTDNTGHITAGGIDRNVTFTRVAEDDQLEDNLDDAYRAKYSRWPSAVDGIVSDTARSTTLRVDPA